MLKSIVLVVLVGAGVGACSVSSERVVEKPVPATTTQRTTTVSTDPYAPAATTTTTTYTTPTR
jgi:hypothetical protein